MHKQKALNQDDKAAQLPLAKHCAFQGQTQSAA